MLYVLICEDKPDSEDLRKSVRPDHLEHIKTYDVRFAGPMLSDDGETMIGSIIVVDVEDRAGVDGEPELGALLRFVVAADVVGDAVG